MNGKDYLQKLNYQQSCFVLNHITRPDEKILLKNILSWLKEEAPNTLRFGRSEDPQAVVFEWAIFLSHKHPCSVSLGRSNVDPSSNSFLGDRLRSYNTRLMDWLITRGKGFWWSSIEKRWKENKSLWPPWVPLKSLGVGTCRNTNSKTKLAESPFRTKSTVETKH